MEGGYYRETYRAEDKILVDALPDRYIDNKHFSTTIYYFLTPDTFSAMHMLPTDEIYHFYLGDPVEQVRLYPDGKSEVVTLGSDIVNGELIQTFVKADVWQGSRLMEGGSFALMGRTMSPAFDFGDYVAGERDKLIEMYPDMKEWIMKLTRA
jgi:hypothetical protein